MSKILSEYNGSVLSVEEFKKILNAIDNYKNSEVGDWITIEHFPTTTVFDENVEEYIVRGTLSVNFHVANQYFVDGKKVEAGLYVRILPTNINTDLTVKELIKDLSNSVSSNIFDF